MRAFIHTVVSCITIDLGARRYRVLVTDSWPVEACHSRLKIWLRVSIFAIENSYGICLMSLISVTVSWGCVHFWRLKLREGQSCLLSRERLSVASDGPFVWSDHICFRYTVLGLESANVLFDQWTLNLLSLFLSLAEILINFKVLWC